MLGPISIASFSFHGALGEGTFDVFTYLEACRYRYHLDTADIWNGLLGPDVEVQLDHARLRKVRAAMDERGLTCVNYHADGCHPYEPDADVRARHRDLAFRHLEAAEILGAQTVRIDPGGRDRHWSEAEMEILVPAYREFADFAARAGFRVGPETHWGAGNYPDNMLALHAAVDRPEYGILLHLGKDTWTSPDDYDRALAPIAIHTHIDQRTCETRLGAALAILAEAGYSGALGVEHHTGKNEFMEVAAQIGAVRRELGRMRLEAPAVYGGNPLLNPADERSLR
ncbi:MAG: TIM barrel protein [Fimbriimonadaceae bacterium]|nr:TIM barrel protein [Fimbriimonadaceae bacterium]